MNDLEFKVLFVDDDLNMQETVVSSLLDSKVKVTSAFDGATGIALAKEQKFDLVLLDLGLPDTEGFAVLKELKEHPDISPCPVILLTGRSSSAEKVQGFRLGAVDYVTKPFDLAELRARGLDIGLQPAPKGTHTGEPRIGRRPRRPRRR